MGYEGHRLTHPRFTCLLNKVFGKQAKKNSMISWVILIKKKRDKKLI